MMILRVYAMWNRSRRILGVLLLIYVLGIVATTVYVGVYISSDTHFSVTVVQVLDFSFCNYMINTTPYLTIYATISRHILGALLLILAVTQTLRQSIDMYKATKHWQPNKYMALLVREGILYFVLYVFHLFCYPSPPSMRATALKLTNSPPKPLETWFSISRS
ncbi:hypothetical protein J3R83DRAFT_7276 [Lanmaoa asiatica]|nr:hypothetical protein J3R83DRAFT_7276 [Lanmaoa asiatica]